MAAQASSPEGGDPSINIKYAQSLMTGGSDYSGAGATYHGGGSNQRPNFPPGFHAAGMGGVALNTFWNILPAAVQENVNAQYESYANRRTAKGQSNSSGYQFGSMDEKGEFVMTWVPGRQYSGGSTNRQRGSLGLIGTIDWPKMQGRTTTNKIVKETKYRIDYLGNQVVTSTSKGSVSGSSGRISTLDGTTNNFNTQISSVTVGPLTVGFGSDYSVFGGLGIFGFEIHVGNGFGAVSGGASYTDKDGFISGGDATLNVGPGVWLIPLITSGAPIFAF